MANVLFLTQAAFPLHGRPAPQDVAHGVEICFLEVNALKERLKNQDTALEAMRETLEKTLSSQKKGKEGKFDLLDQRFTTLKKSCDLISQEGKETRQRLLDMEKKVASLEKSMKDLKKSITEALALLLPESVTQSYRVKSGDNLDKIAKRFKTTVRALKKANQLQTDRLAVGQELKIAP